MKTNMHQLVLALGLTVGFGSVAMADDDSSSDATGGFAHQVAESQGVIIQVPIDAQGDELTDEAVLRLHAGQDLSTSGDFSAAFDAGQSTVDQPQIDPSSDSSTSGYGWNSYRGRGWQNSYYYYNSYRPTYYSYGNYWNYSTPYYRNYYNVGNYYGYRYYYYGRCW